MFDSSYLVITLKEKCKEYKISYQGTKAQLIKRLNDYITLNGINVGQVENEEQVEERSEEEEFTDVQINTPPVEVEPDGDLVEEINKNGKRTRVLAHYTFTREFESIDQAYNFLKDDLENNWSRIRMRKTNDGTKDCFSCSTKMCRSKLYILFHDEEENVSLWNSDIPHDHSSVEDDDGKVYGINQVTKEQIGILYQTRVKTATNILYSLREQVSQFKEKKIDDDPDVINPLYVPGLKIPTKLQISNYLHNTFKPLAMNC